MQIKGNGGFETLGEFLCAVNGFYFNYKRDPRLKTYGELAKAAGHAIEGTGSTGGFLVPEEHYNEVLAVALEYSIVRPRARVIPVSSNRITIPALADGTHSSALLGGIVCYWLEEETTITAKRPNLRGIGLTPKKVSGFCYGSNEWLADTGAAAEAVIRESFGQALAYYIDDACIEGTGSAQPLGVKNAPATITVSRGTASEINYNDVLNMLCRLLPVSHDRAVWLANPETIPQLLNITFTALVSSAGGRVTIAGRPVYFTEKCAALGSKGDLMLCDFGAYVLGDRGLEVSISMDEPTGFAADETAWRLTHRVDGQPIPSAAITPKNGSSTLSPFVVLE